MKINTEEINNDLKQQKLNKGFMNNSRNIEDSNCNLNNNNNNKLQTDKMHKITQKLENIKKNSVSEKNIVNNSSW